MDSLLLAILAAALAVDGEVQPLAWMNFAEESRESYAQTPYVWLGDGDLRLTSDVRPSSGTAIDLLWGSKNDERGARLIINGRTIEVKAGGYDGFRWQRVDLPEGLAGNTYDVTISAAEPKAAFLAAVRLVPATAPLDQPLPAAAARSVRLRADQLQELLEELHAATTVDPWRRAAIHGEQAAIALRRCRKYVDGWLNEADPRSGLIPRNLDRDRDIWNGKDSAADNYPFLVLTCALTDPDLFAGRMRAMLDAEQRLTSRLGNLVDVYSFGKQGYQHESADLDRMIFDSSEYVKDGLLPLTEWLGPSPWSVRMLGIADSLIEHAAVETPCGRIASTNVEVNGEMMQFLSRLYFFTGRREYLEMACRIADYYLLGDHHPTRDLDSLRLRDHGCELISGLTEVYVACHHARPDRQQAYQQPLHEMLDRILEVAVNEHGMMFDAVDPRKGEVLNATLGDNWGYNYNGFYAVYLVDGTSRYRDAVRRVLGSLDKHYRDHQRGSDSIADAVEGAINLYNREPVPSAAHWIDYEIRRMLNIQQPSGVIEGWHGDGNYARTAILWALWKQQGVTVQPWREDLTVGALMDRDQLLLRVSAAKPWQGKIVFDRPRHRTDLRLPIDYPRINQFPEWFTVDEADRVRLAIEGGEERVVGGAELIAGWPLNVPENAEIRVRVEKQ